jgi:hypothetical protein
MRYEDERLSKPSRTLVFSEMSESTETMLMDIASSNLTSHLVVSDKGRKTGFLEFESLKDSIAVYASFTDKAVNCRYGNYRLFIHITSDTSLCTYNVFKRTVQDHLRTLVPDANIMYFKLFQVGDRLTGNGYIVVDKHDHARLLVRRDADFMCRDEGNPDALVTFQLHNFKRKRRYTNGSRDAPRGGRGAERTTPTDGDY